MRQQLTVLRRSAPKRLQLTSVDRLFWVWLRRVWNDWKSALLIVKPETVIAWHRKGFRLFWRWKIQHGKPGRPAVPPEVRDLIRMMSGNNPCWGAPRIHGELLKLGIEMTEPTVAKYLVRPRKPPSQTWVLGIKRTENRVRAVLCLTFGEYVRDQRGCCGRSQARTPLQNSSSFAAGTPWADLLWNEPQA